MSNTTSTIMVDKENYWFSVGPRDRGLCSRSKVRNKQIFLGHTPQKISRGICSKERGAESLPSSNRRAEIDTLKALEKSILPTGENHISFLKAHSQ